MFISYVKHRWKEPSLDFRNGNWRESKIQVNPGELIFLSKKKKNLLNFWSSKGRGGKKTGKEREREKYTYSGELENNVKNRSGEMARRKIRYFVY